MNSPYPLLFPKDREGTALFQRLEEDDGVLFSGEEGSVSKAIYPELNLSYSKGAKTELWECSLYPDYALSNQKLSSFVQPLTKEEEGFSSPQVFSRDFNDYHLLEHKEGNREPLLILSGREYLPYRVEDDPLRLKHTRKHYVQKPVEFNPPLLFSYVIDSERGLSATSPEGYLYLSYVLYTQGKYPQAALAMRQGFHRMQGISPQAKEILHYFERWNNEESNAKALKAELALYQIEQKQTESLSEEEALAEEASLYEALFTYKKYLAVEEEINPQLRLSKKFKQKFQFLGRRSTPWVYHHIGNEALWSTLCQREGVSEVMAKGSHQEIKESLKNGVEEHLSDLNEQLKQAEKDRDHQKVEKCKEEIVKYTALLENFESFFQDLSQSLDDAFIDFNDLQFYANHSLLRSRPLDFSRVQDLQKAGKLIRFSLDREIEERVDSIEQKPPQETEGIIMEEGVPLFVNGKDYLISEEIPFAEKQKILSHISELEHVFQKHPDSYEAEMSQEIAEDVREYCRIIGLSLGEGEEGVQKVFSGINQEKVLNELPEEILDRQGALKQKKQKLRSEIIEQFQLKQSSDALLRQLKEEDPVVIDLFREGRFCFGSNDFSKLMDQGVIAEDSIDLLNELYREYLLCSTELTQVESIIEQLKKLDGDESEAAKVRLVDLLQTKRVYDERHPLAPALLLLEEELGVICRKTQVQHFVEMITHQSSFKHEAWAGGKTYILRHLITKFHADGFFASSLLTHAPLIEEHHESLKESTTAFYGQQAYRTEFSRTSPDDGVAIRREHLKLIKAVQEKGRTDQTIHSFINIRHAHNLRLLNLSSGTEESDVDAIFAFNNYLSFRKEHIILGSDEIEQLTTPDTEYNYAIGAPQPLEQTITQPAIKIGDLLTSEAYQKYAPYFLEEGRSPGEMSKKERKNFTKQLAADLFKHYKVEGISLKEWQNYCAPVPEDIGEEAFEKLMETHLTIAALENAANLQSVSIFFSQIFPLAYKAKLGVHYGRSLDGVHTKPFRDSKCSERSQYSSLHLMALYSVLDVLKHGVKKESQGQAIATYVTQLREKAAKERLQEELFLDETEVGEFFRKNFSLSLSHVDASDYETIASTINGDASLKMHFLNEANFKNTMHYSKRLVGNAKQISYECQGMWGSSGNAERARTLPRKVQLDPSLMRQKGTIGRIYYNLIKDYEEGDISLLEDTTTLPQFLAENLGVQSAFIDVGPFFEGASPEECVKRIQESGYEGAIRYVNSSGEVVVRIDSQDIPGDEEVPEGACITLFFHSDRRGRNLLLPDRGEHWISISFDTTLTDFSQGGMRARRWGMGQRLRYLLDRGAFGRMKGELTPAKLFGLLIKNETNQMKKLHYISSRQEIEAVGDAAVQALLRAPKDRASLLAIKNHCNKRGYLEKSTEIDLEKMSRPRSPKQTTDYFVDLIDSERKRLEELKHAILNDADILDEVKDECGSIIDKMLEVLSEDLLLEAKYYSEKTSVLDVSTSTETVEVEQEAIADQEIAAQVDEEMVAELDLEHAEEAEMDIEGEIREPRPKSPLFLHATHLKAPENLNYDDLREAQLFGKTVFLSKGNVRVSGREDALTELGYNALWFEEECEHRGLLNPSVLLICNADISSAESIMGKVKDADLVFETYGKKYNKEPFTCFHYKFNDQRPLEEVFEELNLLGPNLQEEIVKAIVVAKCFYAGDVTFSERELEVFRRLLTESSDSDLLVQQLRHYLERHFPENERQLLRFC